MYILIKSENNIVKGCNICILRIIITYAKFSTTPWIVNKMIRRNYQEDFEFLFT